jgi:tRNA modification GTPase
MRPGESDTIFAVATARGRAGVAILRLSGPAAAKVCRCLTGRPPPPPRRASLRRLHDPADGGLLDQALVLWFPGPDSQTGEDMLELQTHGSPGVLGALADILAAIPGLRPAEPGEFARRAFHGGRLDLTAIEGLADLVAAETRAQVRQAARQLDGALGRLYEAWREALLQALARLEAEIDFAAEEEVPAGMLAVIRPEIERLTAAIAAHLTDGGRGERLRDGLRVAILGPPNAGKSTLLNLLAQRDVAIVAATPGTTRDVLEVPLDLAGLPVTLVDTAGLRAAVDDVEAEGVRRARRQAAEADLRLLLVDGGCWPALDPETAALIDDQALVVVSKVDLGSVPAPALVAGRAALRLSCRTGEGVTAVLEALAGRAAAMLAVGAEPVLTRARHRSALQAAAEALGRFLAADRETDLALLAEDLRLASRALGRITGKVGVEDLLDRIFGEFCIGK